MKLIEFTSNQANIKVVRRSDFEAIGVTDQDDVEFNRLSSETKGQAWVSDAAAEALVERDKFRVIENDEDRAPGLRQEPESTGGAESAGED